VFFQDSVHRTVTGHAVWAAGLERFLRDSGLLDPSRPETAGRPAAAGGRR
jgi:hypothetical protein